LKRIIDAPGVAPTLFPPIELGAFLNYVRTVWDAIKVTQPTWWKANKETTLVGGFFVMLNNDETRMNHGVGFGHFIYEASEVQIHPVTNVPYTIGRTDIQFAYATWMGPTLTLEFKRLNNKTSLRQKYFTDGLARFVSGKYAPAHDTAMMVGLVDGSTTIEKDGLLKYLRQPKCKISFVLQAMSHPEYGDPSQDTPAVDFDTLHARNATCSCPQIRVGHILLKR
jgi:hypothetical protein